MTGQIARRGHAIIVVSFELGQQQQVQIESVLFVLAKCKTIRLRLS